MISLSREWLWVSGSPWRKATLGILESEVLHGAGSDSTDQARVKVFELWGVIAGFLITD